MSQQNALDTFHLMLRTIGVRQMRVFRHLANACDENDKVIKIKWEQLALFVY